VGPTLEWVSAYLEEADLLPLSSVDVKVVDETIVLLIGPEITLAVTKLHRTPFAEGGDRRRCAVQRLLAFH
jgi:hypothetical protein